MKKTITVLLSLALMLSLVACGSQAPSTPTGKPSSTQTTATLPYLHEQSTSTTEENTNPPAMTDRLENNQELSSTESTSDNAAPTYAINIDGVSTLDELEDRIDEELANAIASLNTRWETLKGEIDTFEKYCDNAQKVSGFYETIVLETEQMCTMLKEYSAVYARMILDSDLSNEKKYRAADGINDKLYDDACDEINDEIYNGILDEMNECFYDGVLDDQPDGTDYSDWYEVSSKEYKQWYEASSDVYSLYYDTGSDIFSFYYDLSVKLYSGDLERAEKIYEKFLNKVYKEKGIDTEDTELRTTFDTTLRSADNTEELEATIEEHVSACLQALKAEWETLSTGIDTFEKYQNNIEAVEEFHTHITDSTLQILAMIGAYGVDYAEMIMQADSSTKNKYKDFEDWKECIYDDACEEVKDAIYDDLLEEVQEYYYDGLIASAKDSVPYSEWSSARSDAYGWWSETRGDVYSDWSGMRGDCYSFYSEIRGELYSGDTDGANDELQRFIKKVEKMQK